MNKLLFHLIIRQTKPKKDQGFSLLEVLVAVLVSSAFLMGTLQAMTINAVMQVKAERQAQANFWIQEDLEKVQATASALTAEALGTAQTKAKCRVIVKSNNPTARFGGELITRLNNELSGDADAGTYSVNVTSFKRYETDDKGNHEFDDDGDPSFVAVKDSQFTTVNKTARMQVVRTGDTTNPDDPDNLVTKPYRLVRVVTVDSSTKYDVLQIYYRVGEPYDSKNSEHQDADKDELADDFSGKTSIIAENYAEIIPAVVSQCK